MWVRMIIVVTLTVALFVGGCASGKFELQSSQRRAYRVEKIKNRHPQWDEPTVQKVASRVVEVGMTREMVREALGEPDTVARQGNEEKWGYAVTEVPGDAPVYKRFVYFVRFKEGRVIRTTGDRSQLSQAFW